MIVNQEGELPDEMSALSLAPWMDKLNDTDSDLERANRVGSDACCRLITTNSVHVSDGLRLIFNCSTHGHTEAWLKGPFPLSDGEMKQMIHAALSAAITTKGAHRKEAKP